VPADPQGQVLEFDESVVEPACIKASGKRPGRTQRLLFARLTHSVVAGLLAIVVAFKLRTLPIVSDPWGYVHAAMTFPKLTWLAVAETRYGVELPLVVITRLFHDSELTFYLTPLAATGFLVGSCYWLMARYFGSVAAVVGSLLLLSNSVVLMNATRLYPDIFAASATCLTVALAVAARDRWAKDQRVTRALLVLLLSTGGGIGLMWWMRETSIFAWPVIAAVLLWRGGPPRRAVLPTVGGVALLFLLIEMGISWWAFGDPMLRFKALTAGDMSQGTAPADVSYLHQPRIAYLEAIPSGMAIYPDGWWMMSMAVIAYTGGLRFPRRVGLFAAWFVLVALTFVAVGGGLRPEAPNIRLDVARYWLAFLPPMIMATVGTVTVLIERLALRWENSVRWWPRGGYRPAAAALVAALLALVPLHASAQTVGEQRTYVVTNHGVAFKFRNWLHRHDAQVSRIYTDFASARQLPTFTRSFSGRKMAHAKFFALDRSPAPRPGDYVVLFSAHDNTCGFCNEWISDWLSKHRHEVDRWDKVWQTPDRTFEVYRVPTRSGGH
jgi:hypothetical protein